MLHTRNHMLTLYQTTKFYPFPTESIYRPDDNFNVTQMVHFFPTMFSKPFFLRVIKSRYSAKQGLSSMFSMKKTEIYSVRGLYTNISY